MFVDQMNLGGTEIYMLNLALALKPLGITVGIATTGGPMIKKCRDLGIRVHLLPRTAELNKVVSRLFVIIKSNRYQLVHANDSHRLVTLLYRQHRIPIIITVHGCYYDVPALRQAAKIARHTIAVTPAVRDWLRRNGVPTYRCIHIPVGIQTNTFRPLSQSHCRKRFSLPENANIVAYASRLAADKYPIARQVISAGEQIARKSPHFTLVLAGPGPYRKQLRFQASNANRRLGRNAIIVRPPIMDIWNLYGASNAVIGTGTVANEAMACGKPLIAVGIKGYYGIVRKKNMEQAMKAQFGDHAAKRPLTLPSLITDMKSLLINPSLARSLGKMGRRVTVQRYSIRKISKRIQNLYIGCL